MLHVRIKELEAVHYVLSQYRSAQGGVPMGILEAMDHIQLAVGWLQGVSHPEQYRLPGIGELVKEASND